MRTQRTSIHGQGPSTPLGAMSGVRPEVRDIELPKLVAKSLSKALCKVLRHNLDKLGLEVPVSDLFDSGPPDTRSRFRNIILASVKRKGEVKPQQDV